MQSGPGRCVEPQFSLATLLHHPAPLAEAFKLGGHDDLDPQYERERNKTFTSLKIGSDDSSTIVVTLVGCPNIRCCYAIGRRAIRYSLSFAAPSSPLLASRYQSGFCPPPLTGGGDDHCAMVITQHNFRRTTHSLARGRRRILFRFFFLPLLCNRNPTERRRGKK